MDSNVPIVAVVDSDAVVGVRRECQIGIYPTVQQPQLGLDRKRSHLPTNRLGNAEDGGSNFFGTLQFNWIPAQAGVVGLLTSSLGDCRGRIYIEFSQYRIPDDSIALLLP
jgi:hypothetical protein